MHFEARCFIFFTVSWLLVGSCLNFKPTKFQEDTAWKLFDNVTGQNIHDLLTQKLYNFSSGFDVLVRENENVYLTHDGSFINFVGEPILDHGGPMFRGSGIDITSIADNHYDLYYKLKIPTVEFKLQYIGSGKSRTKIDISFEVHTTMTVGAKVKYLVRDCHAYLTHVSAGPVSWESFSMIFNTLRSNNSITASPIHLNPGTMTSPEEMHINLHEFFGRIGLVSFTRLMDKLLVVKLVEGFQVELASALLNSKYLCKLF